MAVATAAENRVGPEKSVLGTVISPEYLDLRHRVAQAQVVGVDSRGQDQ